MSIDFTTMNKAHMDQGPQRPRLPVDDAGSYSGNQTLYMSYPMRELVLVNDSATVNLTAVVTGPASYSINILLLPGDIWDERMSPFTQVAVTTTGAWRYVVRSGLIA